MEELQKVAISYYNNGSSQVKFLTQEFFERMDTDHDGKIQFQEFIFLLNKKGYHDNEMNRYLFSELDTNNNNVLDFNEFLTFYYIIKTQQGFCCKCWMLLKGTYFTCVTCFDCPSSRTFDLCPSCYIVPNPKPFHHHKNFVDTTLLLRARRNSLTPSSSHAVQEFMKPSENSQIIQVNHQQRQQDSGLEKMRFLEHALAAGAIGVAAFCTIM